MFRLVITTKVVILSGAKDLLFGSERQVC